jgi:5-methylcytosine-specific restriction endonuclease McrA
MKRRRKLSHFERSFIQERAGGCCEYCKFPFDFSHDAFHIEHIIPLQKNGSDELENLAFACDGCNSLKWTHIEWPDPESGQKVSLFNPRTEEWSVHFAWIDDFISVSGLTHEGRATLNLLKMNRPG